MLRAALEQQLYAVLPNTLEEEAEAAERRRAFRLERKPGGGWRVHADLTHECGERLHAALSAEAQRDSRNPDDTAAWRAVREEAARTGQDADDVLRNASPELPGEAGSADGTVTGMDSPPVTRPCCRCPPNRPAPWVTAACSAPGRAASACTMR